MKHYNRYNPIVFLVIVLVLITLPFAIIETVAEYIVPDDPWTYDDGTPIVCRVQGCGKKPMSHSWDGCYCADHYGRSKYATCRYDSCREKPEYEEYWRMYCKEHLYHAER